jgi:dihydrofolate reductase
MMATFPTQRTEPRRIESYAIVSENGMLANAAGVMPDSLKFAADQRFFEFALDRVDVVVHGRHSHEQQPASHLRHRLILTRQIRDFAADPSNPRALFWNPKGGTLEQALIELGQPGAKLGIIGGTDVFGIFLGRYEVFHLSRVPHVQLPVGRPVFPGVPTQTPEEVLAGHGLHAGPRRVLDEQRGVSVVSWQRSSTTVSA